MVASRNSRKAAHAALKAYQETPGFAARDGMLTSIVDLVTDLLHLAEAVSGQDGETTGEHAILHYQLDLDEADVVEPEQWQKDLSALGTEPGPDDDTESSASRQHFIDTGHYLPKGTAPPDGFTGPWAG